MTQDLTTQILFSPAQFLKEFQYFIRLFGLTGSVELQGLSPVHASANKETTVTPVFKNLQGYKLVAKDLAASCSRTKWLGIGPKEYSLVEDWLSHFDAEKTMVQPSKDWNEHFRKCTFALATKDITLVDAIIYQRLFGHLHQAATRQSLALFARNWPFILRWFDTVQRRLTVDEYPIIETDIEALSVEANKGLMEEQQKKDKEAAATATTASKDKKEAAKVAKKDSKKDGKNDVKKEVKGKKEEPAKETAESNATFANIDVRVGKIVQVEKHASADSLYVEQIDLGEEKPRTIVSGLVNFVPIEKMLGAMVLVVCNLKPANMRGVKSEGMVLCASNAEKTVVELLVPPQSCVPGDIVLAEGFDRAPVLETLNPKKKIFETVATVLKTNDSLEATYAGKKLYVSGKGTIMSATLKQADIK